MQIYLMTMVKLCLFADYESGAPGFLTHIHDHEGLVLSKLLTLEKGLRELKDMNILNLHTRLSVVEKELKIETDVSLGVQGYDEAMLDQVRFAEQAVAAANRELATSLSAARSV